MPKPGKRVAKEMAKVEGSLRAFRGQDDDLDEFWQKFRVVGKIQKWTTGKERMAHLPLYLSGDAFTVWSQMEDADQEDEDKVKERLTESFVFSAGEAYSQFVRRRKREDETVDAYASDLRRLLKTSGHKEAADGKDPVLVEQFLTGLPKRLSNQLRLSAASAGSPTLLQLTKQARALFSAEESSNPVTVSAAASAVTSGSRVCYACGEVGHLRRECPKRRRIQCFSCRQYGHMKRDCPEAKPAENRIARGAGRGTSNVTAVSKGAAEDVCVSLVAQSGGSLPKIYVSVGGQKLKAAIDSCSNRSLVSTSTAHALGVPVGKPEDVDAITAIDGNSLDVVGVAELTVSRHDDKVYLPEIVAQFLVVKSLDVIRSDLLIGIDVISSAGGVALEYAEAGGPLTGAVFGSRPVVAVAQENPSASGRLPRQIQVHRDGKKVMLEMNDCEATFDPERGFWEVSWQWKDGAAPSSPIGSGIGEYSRQRLTDNQEEKFVDEIQKWIQEGWLVPYDETVHGEIGGVLPLLAVCQEHKESTPIRPCLDYRDLNSRIVSLPGLDAPACEEKLREWRRHGKGTDIVDIRKAFLNVHVHPTLQRFQVVAWKGQKYIMQRMGFGLSIAPKVMDAIVKWVTKDFPDVDNYVDDIRTPQAQTEELVAALQQYGLPTKPPAKLEDSCVLGLKIGAKDGQLLWKRRDPTSIEIPTVLTRRSIFRWCGALTAHYPVCRWLRPMSSYLRRLASLTESWDQPISKELEALCRDLMARLLSDDPVHGVWSVPAGTSKEWKVWCDASSIAFGAALERDGEIVEDRCWLREKNDRRHINLSELEATIKGLNLAVKWNIHHLKLMTDSKTVYGWLKSLFGDMKRIKVSGLNEVVVQRRLQTIADLVDSACLTVDVEWIPSASNLADQLTRVPEKFTQFWRSKTGHEAHDSVVTAACADGLAIAPVSLDEIAAAQKLDDAIQATTKAVESGSPVAGAEFKKIQRQLCVVDGMLMRSIKLSSGTDEIVPVVAKKLETKILRSAHLLTGHAGWEGMWRFVQGRCYFPGMATKCQEFVQHCSSCVAASPQRGQGVPPTRPDQTGGPWHTVQIDTLELGGSCVLVCVDMFTKWLEVVPLKRHDSASVAAAFTSLCLKFGPPAVIRCDNGTEFVNSVVGALFRLFGVRVQHGAVRHPQSQGGVERANRTLLTLIRKTTEESDDWKSAIEILVYNYRIRPHSSTRISPMEAMFGWTPRSLLVEKPVAEVSLSAWVDKLRRRMAQVRDYLDEELATHDFIEKPGTCPYEVGDYVMLRRPERRQKMRSPYERGWSVESVVAPSTVSIKSRRGGSKIVNVELLKMDVDEGSGDDADEDDAGRPAATGSDDDSGEVPVPLILPNGDADAATDEGGPLPSVAGGRQLRDRATLRLPGRYSS